MGAKREGREWFILANEYESEEAFRQAVRIELADLEIMGFRLGRGFMSTPIRKARDLGGTTVWDTIAWGFCETFMPAVRDAAPADAEPVEA